MQKCFQPAVRNRGGVAAFARRASRLICVASCLAAAGAGRAAEQAVLPVSGAAARLDSQLDWSRAELIVVQEGQRYKTLDSFARERVTALYGRDHLPGLSPLASLFELLFNREAYLDQPIVRIKDRGLRVHFTDGAHFAKDVVQRIRESGCMTPRELAHPHVQARLRELEPRVAMGKATNRVRAAEAAVQRLDRYMRIVPQPGAGYEDPWYTPDELRSNAALALPEDQRPGTEELVRQFGRPMTNVTPEQAVAVVGPWRILADGWRRGEAAAVQSALNRLFDELPRLAAAGVYADVDTRVAERKFYSLFVAGSILSKSALGMWLYLIGSAAALVTVITSWRGWRVAALVLVVIAAAWQAYGILLRWEIVGRIPVANMYEAINTASCAGVLLAILLELLFWRRLPLPGLFLLAGHVLGFAATLVAGFVLPGGATISPIMGILDNIMLRLHTTMIVFSYILIFLAAVIAVVYLFGYYFTQHRTESALAGLLCAGLGGLLLLFGAVAVFGPTPGVSGAYAKHAWAGLFSAGAAGAALILLVFMIWRGAPGLTVVSVALVTTAFGTLALGSWAVVQYTALTMLSAGLVWSIGMALGKRLSPRLALPGAGGPVVEMQRPVMAGALPGDSCTGGLPNWLQSVDWFHLIILNLAFVLLFFGGLVLGAMWADYSWGRPWGWDPKETFALNTWLIYAVLIHVRFIVRRRALWTAWLSVAGCAMMAFNWFVVNFYIVGLHSYA